MISSTFDKNKVFTVMWSEIEGRIDPSPYCSQRRAILHQVNCLKCGKKQLKHLCSFISDRTNDLTKIERYIGLENISGLINDFIGKNQIKTINGTCGIAQKGDLLFAKLRPYLNKVMITDCSSYTSTEIVILRNKSEVLTKYLLAYLTSDLVLNQTKYIMTGNTLPRLQLNDIKNFVIPILPLEIQSKVVQIFEDSRKKYFSKLSQAEELLKSIDTYLLSELNLQLPELKNDLTNRKYIVKSKEIIGNRFDGFYNRPEFIDFLNKVLLLSNNTTLCDVIYGESGVVYKTEDERNSGIGILRANNIDVQSNELDLSDIKYINDELVLPKRQKLLANDILMCSASGSKSHAGKVAFIENDLPYYFGGFMMVLRAKSKVNMRYVFEYMCSSIYRTLLFRSLGGTNINNVNFELIKNIPIILPDNQTEIVNKIKHIRECAKTLKIEAQQCIDSARAQIEQIILGE